MSDEHAAFVERPHLLSPGLAAVDAAISGKGQTLVYSGAAGVGKTTVVDHVVRHARSAGCEVRHTTGTPLEAGLALGGLLALFLADLRTDQSGLLGAALGLAQPETESAPGVVGLDDGDLAFRIASTIQKHIESLLADRPVVIVVDDLQWVDPTTIDVLFALARRLSTQACTFVFAVRAGTYNVPLFDKAFESILVSPLSFDEGLALAAKLGVPDEVRAALVRLAGGSPLVLKELVKKSSVANSQHPSDPIGDRALHGRISSLSPMEQQFCVLVSLEEDLVALRETCVRIGLDFERSVSDLVSAGVVERSESKIRLTHPLLRDAVHAQADANAIRSTHRWFAETFRSAGDLDREANHLYFATNSPNHRVALLIEQSGDRAHRKGALREGAQAMLRSAELTLDPALRMRRMLRGAALTYYSGSPPTAIGIAKQAKQISTDQHLNAEADQLICIASEWAGDVSVTVEELLRLAEYFRKADPRRSVVALAQCAAMAFLVGDLAGGIVFAEESVRLAEEIGDVVGQFVGKAHLGWNLLLAGRSAEAHVHIDALAPLMRALADKEDSVQSVLVAQRLSIQFVVEEQWDDADNMISEALERSRTLGLRLSAALFSMIRGAQKWRQGEWDIAYPLVTVDIYEQYLPDVSVAWSSSAAAQVTAAMGKVEETYSLANQAIAKAAELHVPLATAWANTSLGHLELSRENFELAIVHFDRVAELTADMGLREPGLMLWHGDWIETLLELNRMAEARRAIDELESVAMLTNRVWAKAVLLRSRAQVDDNAAGASEKYGEALALLEGLGMPFEVARTEFLFGRHELQSLADGQLRLLRARSQFEQLGAPMWTQRVERLLGKRRMSPLLKELSATERRVALLVANGKTNRQVSTELGVSERTVEFHLRSIYRKLNVTRRSEFVAVLSGPD